MGYNINETTRLFSPSLWNSLLCYFIVMDALILWPTPGSTSWMRSMLTSADQQLFLLSNAGVAQWNKGSWQSARMLTFTHLFVCIVQSRDFWDCDCFIINAAASPPKSVTYQDVGLLMLLCKQTGGTWRDELHSVSGMMRNGALGIICCPRSTV